MLSIFVGIFYVVAQRWRAIFTAVSVPAILWFLPEMLARKAGQELPLWFSVVIAIFLWTLFAVPVHRIVVLGISHVPRWGVAFNWTWRETRFLLLLLVATAACWLGSAAIMKLVNLLPIAVSIHVGWILWTFWLGVLILAPPFALLLPAIAVDDPATLPEIFRCGFRYYWLLAGVVYLIPATFGMAYWLVNPLLEPVNDWLPLEITFFLGQLTEFVVSVLEIAALSLAYHEIQLREGQRLDPLPGELE